MQSSLDIKRKIFSLKTMLSFFLAFAIIIYLLLHNKMDMAKVNSVLRDTNLLYYFMAFAVYYTAFPFRGLRFRIILKDNCCHGATRDLTGIILISWFVNCIVPAKLGDVFRAYLVKKKYNKSLATVMGSIFAERVFDLFILYLFIGASGLMAFRDRIPDAIMVSLQTSFLILAAVLAVLLFMRYLGMRLASRLPEKAGHVYRRFLSGTLSSFRSNWKVAALTFIIWFLEGASFYLVTRALGMKLTFVVVLFVGLISALLTALPITPAGLGIVEAAKFGVLVFFGVDRSIAVSAALLDRVINYWSLLLTGFIVYVITGTAGLLKEVGASEVDDHHSYV